MNKNRETSLTLVTPITSERRRSPFRFATIRLLMGVLSLLLASLSAGTASQNVNLAWNRNSEANITNYRLYYGTQSGAQGQFVDAGNVTSATVPNLSDSTTYFFTLKAVNTAGLQSQSSNEVSYKTANPAALALTVNQGTGSGNYVAGTIVPVSAGAAPAGKTFDRWMEDWVILSNPLIATTTATMPFQNVAITAAYKAADTIRYYPRSGFTARMIGGVFEGTNGDPKTGTYTKIHTITTAPTLAWTQVNANLGSFRYLRYRGPGMSWGNVAEIEFYRNGVKVNGTGYGTPGSWKNSGNTFSMALDGNVNTFFDGQGDSGNYVGIDSGVTTL
jgi:hypothetical protein